MAIAAGTLACAVAALVLAVSSLPIPIPISIKSCALPTMVR